MSDVIIYTKTGCPYCAAAKEDYAKRNIAFTEVNITEKPDEKSKILELTGGERIVPVIVDGPDIKIGFGGG
ncbi:MAG: glutaredoxin family protein [candidate division Zixibacteria bacterium]|nr:glutaredoxin family protein [candidate division Zixibacteria bacterium]